MTTKVKSKSTAKAQPRGKPNLKPKPKAKPAAKAKPSKAPAVNASGLPKDQMRVCIVLDRSGSMEGLRREALGAVNDYIAGAKVDKNLRKAVLSILLFDSTSLDWIRRNVPIKDVEAIDPNEYVPSAMTPLYEAIGTALDSLEDAKKAVLVVMTDGLENSSRFEYSLKTIQRRIEQAKKDGWMVLFLGADLTIARQGHNMGLRGQSVAAYSGAVGLRASGQAVAATVSHYAATQSFDEQYAASSAGWTAEARELLAGATPTKKDKGQKTEPAKIKRGVRA